MDRKNDILDNGYNGGCVKVNIRIYNESFGMVEENGVNLEEKLWKDYLGS